MEKFLQFYLHIININRAFIYINILTKVSGGCMIWTMKQVGGRCRLRTRTKTARGSAGAAQSLRLGLRRPTSLYIPKGTSFASQMEAGVCPKSPRRGRPLCRPVSITDAPKHYTTLPYFTINHYIILSAKHKPRKNQIRLFLFIFMCYNSLCIGIILYFYERHTQWDFSIRFSAATMTVS